MYACRDAHIMYICMNSEHAHIWYVHVTENLTYRNECNWNYIINVTDLGSIVIHL